MVRTAGIKWISLPLIIAWQCLPVPSFAQQPVSVHTDPVFLNKAASDTLDKDPAISLQLATAAARLASKSGNKYQLARAWLNMARSNVAQGHYRKAIGLADQSILYFNKTGNKPEEAEGLLCKAGSLKEMGDLSSSLTLHEQCRDFFAVSGDRSGVAETCRSLGALYWKMGNFPAAYANYAVAYRFGLKNRKALLTAQSLNGMGTAARDMGDYASAEKHLMRSFELYRKLNDSLHMAELCNLKGSLYQREQAYEKANAAYDSACVLYKLIQNRGEEAKVLRNQGTVLHLLKQNGKAFSNFTEAGNIFLSIGDSAEYIRTLIQTGTAYRVDRKYTEAHRAFLDALRICLNSKFAGETVEAYNNLGLLFNETGNYPAASEAHKKAVARAREMKDRNRLRYALNLLGNDYFAGHSIAPADTAYNEVLLLAKENNDKKEIAVAAKNLARVRSSEGKYTEAVDLLKQSLSLCQEANNHTGTLQARNELGNVYLQMKNETAALENCMLGIQQAREWKDTYYLALFSRKAADILVEEGNPGNAKSMLDESLSIGIETNNPEIVKYAFLSLSGYYKAMGNPTAALAFFKKYSDLKDSIDNRKQVEQLAMDQLNFDLDQKNTQISHIEQQMQLLENERKLRELSYRQAKLLRNFAVLTALFLLLVVFLLYNRYKLKRNKEKQLEVHLEKIAEINSKLTRSEQDLKELNASKDRFFSIIAHDIKNPLTGLMGFSDHILKNYEKMSPEELLDVAGIMHTASHNLYSLLENLLTWSRLQTGRISFQAEVASLNDILQQSVSLQKANASEKNISLLCENEDLRILADRNMISLVVRNLVSNALKFTRAGGTVQVQTGKSGEFAWVKVKDTGVGIPEEDLGKLFRVDSYFTSRGTGKEEGTGLGLLLCKECVEKNGGNISVESEPGKGSTFSFSVPLAREN